MLSLVIVGTIPSFNLACPYDVSVLILKSMTFVLLSFYGTHIVEMRAHVWGGEGKIKIFLI